MHDDLFWDVEKRSGITRILREDKVIDLIADVGADVYQVAGAFVRCRVTESLLHDLFFIYLEGPMVVVLPPALLDAIINVRIVVAILRKSIMNQDGMQLIGPFLVFDVWGRHNVLELLNFILEALDLLFGCFLVLLQHRNRYFNFILLKLHVAMVKLVRR